MLVLASSILSPAKLHIPDGYLNTPVALVGWVLAIVLIGWALRQTKEQLGEFFSKEEEKIDLRPLVEGADFSPAFDALSKTVMESKFGGAIAMFGGEEALEGLRDPFSSKLKSAVGSIVDSPVFKAQLDHHIQNSTLSEDMISSVEVLITRRLEELTPKMVKELVQELIKEHLGWLVVWGGVFGGLIGLISSFLI